MTARLRLLLAILLLALAPMPAPAVAVSLHACVHSCDGMELAGHTQPACPCNGHMALVPLAVAPMVAPLSPILTAAPPAEASLDPTSWPPPLRPPRA